jgi:hypothetical protein
MAIHKDSHSSESSIFQPNDKGEAASTHLNLENGLFTLASTRWLALHESFSYPTWVATAIKYGKDHYDIVNNTVIYSKGKPL